jgi:hypothetical protein
VDRLLERGEELAALESVAAAARDGRGQLVGADASESNGEDALASSRRPASR